MIDTQGCMTPHINTGECRDPNRAKQILTRPDIRAAYLMGEGHDWIDLALQHCELVIVRIFDMFNDGGHAADADATLYTRHTKEQVYERINSRHSTYRNNPRIKWVISNEPSSSESGKFNRKYMLDWHADAGRYMAEHGYGTALGGFAMAKTNGLPFHNGGDWNKILQVCADYPEWVILDCHEYEFLLEASGHLKTYYKPFPQMYLDAQSVDPANWGDVDYETGNVDDNWKFGNVASLQAYNVNVLKLPPFWFIRGECGIDYTVEEWWKDWVDLVFIPRYNVKASGIHSSYPYWADMFHNIPPNERHRYTNEMFNQDIIQQAAYIKRNAGRGCLANAWFSYNTNPLWTDDDISGANCEAFIHWMEFEQHTVLPLHIVTPTPVPPPPVPVPQPEPVAWLQWNIEGYDSTVNAPVNARVRLTPNGTQIAILPAAPTVTPAKVAPTTVKVTGSDFEWREVILYPDTEKALHGFVAVHVFRQAQSTAPIPETRILTEAEYEQLKTAIQMVRIAVQAIDDVVS